MKIGKTQKGFELTRYSKNGQILYKIFSEDTTLKNAWEEMLFIKDDIELEEEAKQKEKEFLKDYFVKNSTDEIKLKNVNLFEKLKDGMKIVKNQYYNYTGLLYKAKEDFIYDNQKNPILEPDLWEKVGEDKKSDYDEKFSKADFWYADKTYNKGDLVKRYNKLYELIDEKSSGDDPEKSDKWEMIPEE